MIGTIIENSINLEQCNYLIITTAPNETIEQYRNIMNCLEFVDFNIIGPLNSQNVSESIVDKHNKNIIVCSKQFLQGRLSNVNNISWLSNINFDITFIDESHNGGTTKLANDILDHYCKNSFIVQITATYAKPITNFNIPKTNWILWDIEDVKMCKNIDDKECFNIMINKHGDDFKSIFDDYSVDYIIEEYCKYPNLHILTNKISEETVEIIKNNTKNNDYGWSIQAALLLRQNIDSKTKKKKYQAKFQNENEVLKLMYRIFGKKNNLGIPDEKYPDDIVFMKRIDKICANVENPSRTDNSDPLIIMMFLPPDNINLISQALTTILVKNNIIPDYEIVSINSKITNDPKKVVSNGWKKAKLNDKKGVLVLSGKQCSLAVSFNKCDIVILLNNTKSFDMIYQMMFRCMTEDTNKRHGFVIDLNIRRTIEHSIMKYANIIKPDWHPKDAIDYILFQERLISLNADHWLPSFGYSDEYMNNLCNYIYDIYSTNIISVINYHMSRINFKHDLLNKKDKTLFKLLFGNGDDKASLDSKIKEGIEEKKCDNNNDDNNDENNDDENNNDENENNNDENENDENENNNDENENDENIKHQNFVKHIIPLMCLLSVHDEKTSLEEIYNFISYNEYCYNILLDQSQSWWGNIVTEECLNHFIKIYVDYSKEDNNFENVVKVIKETFYKNLDNSSRLSEFIDIYLVPHKNEKKKNAEVSTPRVLRQEMLDKIPADFWNKKQKVFEPCSGKGGFVVDIIDRFMTGLVGEFPDEKERYKVILEECLYFADINPTNIFINKLLIDPYNDYKLNYYQGNTLELNIEDYWGITGFDAVIGNPPYNSSGNTGTGNTIWQHFTKKSLNIWINDGGYLCFVHPPGWRKPNTKKGKFYGFYDLMVKDNQMMYLEIHGIKDGQKTFNCGTRYDWYIIERKQRYKDTIIFDEEGKTTKLNMNKFHWLPNSNINEVQKLLAEENEETCLIIYNRSNYGTDKKHTSKTQNDEFKYPLIHSTPQKGVRYIYSLVNDKGHFGISKIIFGDSGINHVIIDMEGKYGMTEHAMAIQIENEDEGKNLKRVLLSESFSSLLKSCMWGNFQIDWRLFKYFKKDFWKEFI